VKPADSTGEASVVEKPNQGIHTRKPPRSQWEGTARVPEGSTVRTRRRERLVPLAKVQEQPGYEWAKPRWLRPLRSEQRLPFHKPPGSNKLLLDLDDLDGFVQQGRIEAADPAHLTREIRSGHASVRRKKG